MFMICSFNQKSFHLIFLYSSIYLDTYKRLSQLFSTFTAAELSCWKHCPISFPFIFHNVLILVLLICQSWDSDLKMLPVVPGSVPAHIFLWISPDLEPPYSPAGDTSHHIQRGKRISKVWKRCCHSQTTPLALWVNQRIKGTHMCTLQHCWSACTVHGEFVLWLKNLCLSSLSFTENIHNWLALKLSVVWDSKWQDRLSSFQSQLQLHTHTPPHPEWPAQACKQIEDRNILNAWCLPLENLSSWVKVSANQTDNICAFNNRELWSTQM